MGQITETERERRIRQLVKALKTEPPEKYETFRLPSAKAGEPLLCEVVSIPVDEVLLNHRSHRLRSQLEDDPEWQEVANEPHSEAAQAIIARHVRSARSADEFLRLKQSLETEGQQEPGVITHKGVLINANTRAVALRELPDPRKRFIRAAVLPDTFGPSELALLELRLQMQRTLKADYSLTNELLFIEELSSERVLPNSFIAQELRYFPEQPKKGENEVATRLRVLDLLRHMQRISSPPLPLSFFDDPSHALGYQTVKDILPVYDRYMAQDPTLADRYLESVLLAVSVGVTSTHQLRVLDVDFVDKYLMPQLEDEEDDLGVGTLTANLGRAEGKGPANQPTGVDLLNTAETSQETDVDVTALINIVTGKDKSIQVAGPIPGSTAVLEQGQVRDALKSAIITGAKEKKRDDNEEDKRHAPKEALRAATAQVTKANETLRAIAGTADLDIQLQRSLEISYKKLKKSVRNLEATLTDAGVIGE